MNPCELEDQWFSRVRHRSRTAKREKNPREALAEIRRFGELRAWITSIRRDQTPVRAHARKIEWNGKFARVKINPIADWTSEQVWNYIHQHRIPHNPLHDRNYPSIGCTHGTRAIRTGEDPRAGRWSGSRKTECGLHTLTQLSTEPGDA